MNRKTLSTWTEWDSNLKIKVEGLGQQKLSLAGFKFVKTPFLFYELGELVNKSSLGLWRRLSKNIKPIDIATKSSSAVVIIEYIKRQ